MRGVLVIYMVHETTMSDIRRKSSESAASIVREDAKATTETAARIANIREETAARIANEKAETTKAALDSVAQIKINAARMRLEQAERKQALAAKHRLDQAAADIEETRAWRMREEFRRRVFAVRTSPPVWFGNITHKRRRWSQ